MNLQKIITKNFGREIWQTKDTNNWLNDYITLPRKPIIVGLWVLAIICLIALLVI